MHHTESNDVQTCKPEIIAFYNDTISGFDSLDNKWPITLFNALLNIAGVNSFVLHGCYEKNVEIPRPTFLKELAKELGDKHMDR
ncbi:hypothetical protein PR048_020824 [Dryococelus australis]|uniref:Uncharacterized protein n=1 Tax=Dryococelus australis TaxID=614101 RepID=A0ABQ9GWH2_9NEOP|nr:hypothetical protein PR048_020824 [Dryococelus australis]